ncbi:pseudouridine synthase [Crocinitomix catalasitica]|uniref:pseudouridine synthase n=1 Tax=Crocinitomix catalasitica TaxID=184607 RepID=UPI000485AA8D|nr:pseudouridine synthase [Crocinitomix catalasitica]
MTEKHQHYIIFKPWGYLSQFIDNSPTRKNKKKLGDLHPFDERTMSIGRLDQDSEGLLLLTTNGKESYRILSSKYEKEYYVQLDGIIDPEALELLEMGVEISIDSGKYMTKPCLAKKIDVPDLPTRAKKIRDERHGPTSWASITVREGKFRQVRKMTAAVGFPTLRLVRVRIGKITIFNFQAGQVEEVDQLNV